MKICWDNLEGVCLSKEGNLKKGTAVYIEMDACRICGDSYLTPKHQNSSFCSHSCAKGGEKNPFFGKHHTDEVKQKLSKMFSGSRGPMYGIKLCGSLSSGYKGGIYTAGLVSYDTYKESLGIYEDVRKQINTGVLEVKCAYCGKWFAPLLKAVDIRFRAINNINYGEGRLYCSENCKQACPIYGRQKYPKGFKHTTSREVSTYLRQLVLERDNWTCQICGKTINEAQLHVHHMDPVSWNPMFQNDADSCITLCKGCHKMVHSRKGCRYIDLVCKKVE